MKTHIGEVTHYFNRIGVAVLKIKDELKIGDRIHIMGNTTDFEQVITSIEIDHKPVTAVKPGDDFAIKVHDTVRAGDWVYKVD